MKKILFLLIFIVPFVAFSQIWEKADGPYTYNSAFSMFSYNINLHFYSSKDGYLYRNNTEKKEWTKLDTGFFVDKGIIHHFYQNDNVVITTTQNGVYWSYDHGDNWKHFDKKATGITGFPYVLIVDQTIFLQSYYPASLYKLEKGSDKIEKVYTDENKVDSVYGDILVANGDYMFAASPKQTFSDLPEFGKLYISKDKGETWELSESMKERLVNLLFHNDILFAFTKEDELYKSIDYGDTWTIDTNIKVRGTKVISYKDLIFACGNQVLVSSDNGVSWNTNNEGLDWFSCKEILISDDKLYYLTGRNLIYSYDYVGKKWMLNSPSTEGANQMGIIEIRDTLFVSGDFTINFSIDNGKSWMKYSESLYSNYTIFSKLFIMDSIYIVLNQKQTNIYISTDFGNTWKFEDLGNFDPDYWIKMILIMDNRILISSHIYGNYLSEDAGLTWKKYKNNFIEEDEFLYTSIRLNEKEIILYSEEGLYKTYDNGLSWEFEKAIDEVKAHSLTAREGNNLYSFYYDNTIFKSTDLGRTWFELKLNLDPMLNFMSLNVYNGYLILFTTTDLFISSNDGKEWTNFVLDMQSPDGKEVRFDSGIIKDDYLIVTSNYGIWRAKLSDLGIEKITSVESEIERNYLYTFPPYPLPAKSEVKFLFYWDINIPMTTDDISIYDITGKKIDAVDKISLVKQESHYGNLIWDCSTAQPGIYLINIKHGTEEKAVKVVVE